MLSPEEIDVVILCGGRGKRLRPLTLYRPKPMLKIKGRPFLDILISYIASFGFRRFILCVGYKAKVIRDYYNKKNASLEILFSQESKALGTGGAVRAAYRFIQSPFFLITNGDSLCKVNLKRFIDFHFKKRSFLSIVITKCKEISQYGLIKLDKSQRIISFQEKTDSSGGYFVNAGIYIFKKSSLVYFPKNSFFSLEEDYFPKVVKEKEVYGYKTNKPLIDIGTIRRYQLAKSLV